MLSSTIISMAQSRRRADTPRQGGRPHEDVRVNDANIEPVFFAYPDNEVLDALIKRYAATKPEYDFVAPDDEHRS